MSLKIKKLNEQSFFEMENEWNDLLYHSDADKLFLSWHWQVTWWQNWGTSLGLELNLLAVFDRNKLIGLAPLYKQEINNHLFPDAHRLHFIGNTWKIKETIRSEYNSFIVDNLYESIVYDAFLQYINTTENWDDWVVIDAYSSHTFIDRIKTYVKESDLVVREVNYDHGMLIDTTGNFNAFIKNLGKNTRLKSYNHRKKLSKLGRVKLLEVKQLDELELAFEHLNRLHRIRWGKDCFEGDTLSFHLNITKQLFADNRLSFSFLEIDGEVVSVLYNCLVDGCLYNIQGGFDDKMFSNMSLGSIHLMYVIEAAFYTKSINQVNLLAGRGKSSDYKKKFKQEVTEFTSVLIVRSHFLRLALTIYDFTPKYLKSVINKSYSASVSRMKKNNVVPVVILDSDFRSQSGIIQTFGRKGIPIIALSSERDCPAFHSRYITHKFVSPKLDDEEKNFIDFLLKLPYRGVLIYSNDPCAVVIAKYQQQLRNAGYLINISDSITLETTFDKWECYKLAELYDVPMAKTTLVESIHDIYAVWDEFKKPVILKGTTLAGGMYYKLSHKEEISDYWEKITKLVHHKDYVSRRSRVILQEWHQYPMTDNWSCEAFYDQDSKESAFFTIQRIRCSLNNNGTYSSRLFSGQHVSCPEIIRKTRKILSKMKWRGLAHVEYFYVPDKNKFMLTEINPRLPGYSYYPSTAGFDFAYYYYADLIGIPYKLPTTFPKSIYFETFHYPGDLNTGILHMLKGNIAPISFLISYLQLLVPGKKKIIDPIRIDDPLYSLYTQVDIVKLLTKKIINYIKKYLTFT